MATNLPEGDQERCNPLMDAELKMPVPSSRCHILVGIHFSRGIIMGTDTIMKRNNVANTNTKQKFHRLLENIYCAGFGFNSDIDRVAAMVGQHLTIHQRILGDGVSVEYAAKTILTVLQECENKLHCSFLVGGVDKNGVHLLRVQFDGILGSALNRGDHKESAPVCICKSNGSDPSNPIDILKRSWRFDINEWKARELIFEGISAGIPESDKSYGFKVDCCIIRSDESIELCSETVFKNLSQNWPTQLQLIPHKLTLVSETVEILPERKPLTSDIEISPLPLPRELLPPLFPNPNAAAARKFATKRPAGDNDEDAPPIKILQLH